MIIDHIKTSFEVVEEPEITIEANPETLDEEKLKRFKSAGVNRVSIGIQSFNKTSLEYLGRVHSTDKGRDILKIATKIFENVSIDLIYGLTKESFFDINSNIEEAKSFLPKHISCYELTFEKGTSIYNDQAIREEDDGKRYKLVKKLLENFGYRQYEISNYAIPGYECMHNLAYWSNKSYLGFGPSAHSYDNENMTRWGNKACLDAYTSDKRVEFSEKAQEIDKLIMGLRKTDGIEDILIPNKYKDAIDNLTKEGFLETKSGNIAFTEKGALLSNQVLLRIMS